MQRTITLAFVFDRGDFFTVLDNTNGVKVNPRCSLRINMYIQCCVSDRNRRSHRVPICSHAKKRTSCCRHSSRTNRGCNFRGVYGRRIIGSSKHIIPWNACDVLGNSVAVAIAYCCNFSPSIEHVVPITKDTVVA